MRALIRFLTLIFLAGSAMAQIVPAPRSFERVDVVGNDRFRDGDILATSGVAPGRVLSEADLRAGIDALMFTGEFNFVRMHSNGPVLTIIVEEQPQREGQLTFGLGYDTDDGAYGKVGLELRGLFNSGTDLSGELAHARDYTTGYFDLYDSNLITDRIGAGIRVSYGDFDRDDALFEFKRFEIRPYVTFELGEDTAATLRLSHATTDITNIDPAASAILQADAGKQDTNAIGLTLNHGAIDRQLESLSWAVSLDGELAGLGGDAKYAKMEGQVDGFLPIAGGFALRSTFQAGLINGRDGYTPRISDRFALGGSALRGFDSAVIGAKDVAGGTVTRLGGNRYAVLRTELLVPIFDPARGVDTFVFGDIGKVWGLDTPVAPSGVLVDLDDIRSSVGFGASLDSPFGRFEAYWAAHTNGTDLDTTQKLGLAFRSEF